MKNLALVSAIFILISIYMNFFVTPMSNFEVYETARQVKSESLNYNITISWKNQTIEIKDLTYKELKKYQTLSDANLLYFDGEYLFEVPPSDKVTTLGKIINIENNSEILRSNIYVFWRIAFYLSVFVGGFFIFCWVSSKIDPMDEYDYD